MRFRQHAFRAQPPGAERAAATAHWASVVATTFLAGAACGKVEAIRSDALAVDAYVSPCGLTSLTWVAPLANYVAVTNAGQVLFADATGAALSERGFDQYPGVVQACGGADKLAGCAIDAIAYRAPMVIHLIANERMWNVDHALVGTGDIALSEFPAVTAGPCPASQGPCHMDALAWHDSRAQYSVFANGRLYTLDVEGKNLVAQDSLNHIAGFAQGPCAFQPQGACQLDAATYRDAELQVVYERTLYHLDQVTFAPVAPPQPLSNWAAFRTRCGD